jgi:hypothetical protein
MFDKGKLDETNCQHYCWLLSLAVNTQV